MPTEAPARPAADKTSNAALAARTTELEASVELLRRAVAGTSQAGRWAAQVIESGNAANVLADERRQSGADRA